MNRLFPAALVFLGYLLVFLPHFALPLDYYLTITMAYDKPIPRWWTHPELYMGIALVAAGLAALISNKLPIRKRSMLLASVIGLMTELQGVFLYSFSGWMLWLPDYKREYHSAVIALHRGITPALVSLGICVIATAAAGYYWYARRPAEDRSMPGVFSVAGANLFRKPFRTTAVVLICALASGITFTGSYVLLSTLESGRLNVSRFGADIIVVPKGYEPSTRDVILGGEPVEFVMDGAVLDRVRRVEGVAAASPQLYLRALPYRGCCAVLDMLIVAIDPETDFTVKPWIDYTIEDGLGPYQAILGYHVMYAPGQRMQIFDEYMRVVGMLMPTGMEFFDASAFISLDKAYDMASRFPEASGRGIDIPPGAISTVLVKLYPGAGLEDTAARLSETLPEVDVIPVKSLLPPARLWLMGSVEQLWPLLALVWLLSSLILLAVFFMMFNERLREVGIMRALGSTRGWVLRMFMSEAGYIVGIGSIVGVAAGWLFVILYRWRLAESSEGTGAMPGLGITALVALACVLLGLAAGLGSAFFPAYRASGAEPYDAIRRGE